MNTFIYKILLVAFLTLLIGATPAFAATTNSSCKQLYGGGITKEQVCNKPKITATPTPIKQGTTTKGGLPVIPQRQQKTTPSTGPEVLGLIALAPAAGLGFYLRKKS